MRIAVISDIHGNLAALQAVIADIAERAPDEVVVAGDMVNRGPQSCEVVDCLLETGWPMLMGNHEAYILDHVPDAAPLPPEKAMFGSISEWTYRQLRPEQIEVVKSLPQQARLIGPDGSVALVVHATPRALNENITPATSDELLAEMLGNERPDVLACGHTHVPFLRIALARVQLINVGSVGAPFDGDPRARYGLLTWRDGHWRTELIAVPYDRAPTLAAYQHSGMLAQAGPLARLVYLETLTARAHLGPCIRAHRPQLISGELPLADAVAHYLDALKLS